MGTQERRRSPRRAENQRGKEPIRGQVNRQQKAKEYKRRKMMKRNLQEERRNQMKSK